MSGDKASEPEALWLICAALGGLEFVWSVRQQDEIDVAKKLSCGPGRKQRTAFFGNTASHLAAELIVWIGEDSAKTDGCIVFDGLEYEVDVTRASLSGSCGAASRWPSRADRYRY